MDGIRIGLTGDQAIQRKLNQKGSKLKKETLPIAKAGAEIFAREMRRIVRVKTKALQKDIKVRSQKAPAGFVKLRIGPSTKTAHSIPIETGHKPSGLYHEGPPVQAYEYAEPSFEAKEKEVEREVRRRLTETGMNG